jgi:hypothetical protein
MPENSPLNSVPPPDKINATSPIEPGGKSSGVSEQSQFSSYMKSAGPEGAQTTAANYPSPMQLNQTPMSSTPPTLGSIQGQLQAASGSLGDIKNQLHTKGLKLKQSEKYLLRNKLSQADDHLRGANKFMGGDPGNPPDLNGKKNPIARFLTLVSDGQNQLNSAANQIQNLNTSGKHINAGELLLVQVKLQKAQQELDYSSVLLGKAVDVIKTLFNIQI